MLDPFGSMNGMLAQFQQFSSNPMQYIAQRRLNIPQNYASNPQSAIQYLMNTGQLTQEQYNWANNMSKQIQSNPIFRQFMK